MMIKFIFLSLWKLTKIIICRFLTYLGIWWLAAQICQYFNFQLDSIFKAYPVYIFLGLLIITFFPFPNILMIREKVTDRDLEIEIRVGDIFSGFNNSTTLIVGTNTTFDTEVGEHKISPNSIQGKYTQLYFSNTEQLNEQIKKALQKQPTLTIARKYAKNITEYKIGTAIKIIDSNNKAAVFLAISRLNEFWVANSNPGEIYEALSHLWIFIQNNCSKNTILLPLLGTNFGRITDTKDTVIKEFIRSFLIASRDKLFTEKLVIYIHMKDFLKYFKSLDDLQEFLKLECKYRTHPVMTTSNSGTPAS